MKKWIVIFLLVSIFSAIAGIFWHNEYVYSLPTPVPADYHKVNPGDPVDLYGKIAVGQKPVFLHFFNPSCPCSRFNIPHFKTLVKKYGDSLSFAIVVLSKEKKYSSGEIQDKFGINVPVYFDETIAKICGVYSTPQAVIIADGKLYYRGNYNKSRYCTDKNSNYAEMAIDSLINKTNHPAFSQYALVSYGCTLPTCKK
jgi:hypothetical protein